MSKIVLRTRVSVYKQKHNNKLGNFKLIYTYKIVISVCLYGCPITAQEPLDRFALNFDWGTWL